MVFEMEMVVGEVRWPEPPQRPPQVGREAVAHVCRRCFGPIECRSATGMAPSYWCPACATASSELTAACFCGAERAGTRFRCVRRPCKEGGPEEIAVVEK